MSILSTFRTLGILFAPVLIPRAIGYFRSLRNSIRNRPPPAPVSKEASRALNILFCTTALFLFLSLPFNPDSPPANIFDITASRLKTSTDLLFSRLAKVRREGELSPEDDLLRSHLTTVFGRTLYLRFGADTLLTCPFCSIDKPRTYLLYYLPFNTLIPHLFHLFVLGLVTSAPIVGHKASRWRTIFASLSVALAVLEIAIIAVYDPEKHGSAALDRYAIPKLLHNRLSVVRPVAFALFDAACAGVIYLSSTNRFFYTPPTPGEQTEQLVTTLAGTAAGTTSTLHALGLTKNVVSRDEDLSRRSGQYWRGVREAETADAVWQEPEVDRALKMARKKRQDQEYVGIGENEGKKSVGPAVFVDKLTEGLEREED